MTDRELDALVAEKVMGWKIEGRPIRLSGGHFDDVRIPADGTVKMLPSYSTDIAAAWQVVEKVRELNGWPFILESHGDPGAPGRWWAYFQKTIGDRSVNGHGHEAPRAICLAALKAVGVAPSKEKECGIPSKAVVGEICHLKRGHAGDHDFNFRDDCGHGVAISEMERGGCPDCATPAPSKEKEKNNG